MSRMMGFADLKRKEEQEEKKQELYAGGIDERGGGSGQVVFNPNSAKISENIRAAAASSESVRYGSVPEEGKATVVLYRNGFTLNDGPLRDLESPENVQFLSDIQDGMVPSELRTGDSIIDLNYIDKHGEDYVAPPPPAYVAFSGGSLLGSTSVSSGAVLVSPDFAASLPACAPAVDTSQPVTTLQIRTLTGQRLRIQMNQSATIRDLVTAIKVQYTTSDTYTLSAGFPPKDVEGVDQSLLGAGLLSAAITLKKC